MRQLSEKEKDAIREECRKMRFSASYLRMLGIVILILVTALLATGGFVFYNAGELTLLDAKKDLTAEKLKQDMAIEIHSPRNKTAIGKAITLLRIQRLLNSPNIKVAVAGHDLPVLRKIFDQTTVALNDIQGNLIEWIAQVEPFVNSGGEPLELEGLVNYYTANPNETEVNFLVKEADLIAAQKEYMNNHKELGDKPPEKLGYALHAEAKIREVSSKENEIEYDGIIKLLEEILKQ